jgi:hypothetical protein
MFQVEITMNAFLTHNDLLEPGNFLLNSMIMLFQMPQFNLGKRKSYPLS